MIVLYKKEGMKKMLMFFACLFVMQLGVTAQDIQIHPFPRQLSSTGKRVALPTSFRLIGEQEANPRAVALLKQFLGDRIAEKGFPLCVGERGERAVR